MPPIRLARWLTRNDADAADVVQEAYLRAFRYFDSYREGDAKSWLLKIVRRTCLQLARAQPPGGAGGARNRGRSRRGERRPRPEPPGDTEALLLSRSDLRRLDRLIEKLPAPLREVIVLRELHELGYREIAEVTGVPIGTVMSRLHRARAALRRAWEGKDSWAMECDEVRPLLDAYVDGELERGRAGDLRQHLEGCAECGPEAAALERLRDGIRRSAPVYRAPAALRSQIRAALRREAAIRQADARARPAGSPMPPRS